MNKRWKKVDGISQWFNLTLKMSRNYGLMTLSSLSLLAACMPADSKMHRRSGGGPLDNPSEDTVSETFAEDQIGLGLSDSPNRVLVVLKEKPSELVRQALDRLPGANLNAAALAQRVADFKKLKNATISAIATADVSVERDYEHLPVLRVNVRSQEALAKLAADPNVLGVFPDEKLKRNISSSFPFINQPQTVALGYTGQNTAVAVLDSGVDYTRAAFGSCSSPGTPANTCRVAFAKDFATEDNTLDDADLHGTNVAGIVAGLAPSTKILALDVFDDLYAYSSVIIEAINWAIANKTTYNIAALNMSFGASVNTSPCASDPIPVAIQNARDAGILSAVASGNENVTDGIDYPACAPSAVSVGAVYDKSYGDLDWSICRDATTQSDQVACFSNSASFLTLLAPGVGISAAGVGMSGTSQATPHVAGAIAVLRSAFPALSTEGIVNRLTAKGVPVTDSRNNIVKPRLDLLASVSQSCDLSLTPTEIVAAQNGGTYTVSLVTGPTCEWSLSEDADWIDVVGDTTGIGSKSITIEIAALNTASRSGNVAFVSEAASATLAIRQNADTDPPTGSLIINNGAIYTTTRSVNLAISASDASGVKDMCISNSTSCSAWQPFSQNSLHMLGSRQGMATVRVWLRDGANNTTSVPISDTITLDSVAPTMGTVRTSSTRTSINISWTPARDSTSGVASYKLVYFEGSTTPAVSCSSGTAVPVTQSNRAVIQNLKRRTTYTMRLCAIDRAGNISAGVVTRRATSR